MMPSDEKHVMSLNGCLPDGLCAVPDVEISGMSLDSRTLEKGELFVALRGSQQDGHSFVESAVVQGAAAVLAEKDIGRRATAELRKAEVPLVVDENLRRKLGNIAARYFGEPSQSMWGCGITGTNGKTSVAWYSAALLNLLGRKTAVSGTTGWGIPPCLENTNLTTVDPITLQKRLAEFLSWKSRCFVIEVSSHALEQHRIEGVKLDCAVFTNLSRDHLDYHSSLESYAEAKKSLFLRPGLTTAIVNVDDEIGIEIRDTLPQEVSFIGYGCSASASVRWADVRYLNTGIAATLQSPWGEHELDLALYGEFNLSNTIAAICVAKAQGCELSQIVKAASRLRPAPGRMEFFPCSGSATGVVDYAHTPDALTKALKALRHHASGRLICVFGCGGDRDRGKRVLMAEAVQAEADEAWLTTDNPRYENPEDIAEETLAGFDSDFPVTLELERRSAIEKAMSAATRGDIVLIAGKGHESYQDVMGQKRTFSDRQLLAQLQGVK